MTVKSASHSRNSLPIQGLAQANATRGGEVPGSVSWRRAGRGETGRWVVVAAIAALCVSTGSCPRAAIATSSRGTAARTERPSLNDLPCEEARRPAPALSSGVRRFGQRRVFDSIIFSSGVDAHHEDHGDGKRDENPEFHAAPPAVAPGIDVESRLIVDRPSAKKARLRRAFLGQSVNRRAGDSRPKSSRCPPVAVRTRPSGPR